jgi:hypothetical protein
MLDDHYSYMPTRYRHCAKTWEQSQKELRPLFSWRIHSKEMKQMRMNNAETGKTEDNSM